MAGVSPLRGTLLDVSGTAEKPLLLLWSKNHNLTRGVLAISDHSDRNQDTWLVPRRESQALLDALRSALDPLVVLSPGAVTIHPVA
jgi:hypothetical protein